MHQADQDQCATRAPKVCTVHAIGSPGTRHQCATLARPMRGMVRTCVLTQCDRHSAGLGPGQCMTIQLCA